MINRNLPDILKEIVSVKKLEVERAKIDTPIEQLEELISKKTPPLNFAGALMGDSVRIIAECKRSSPTAGLLKSNYNPASIAKSYASNGAAAISVLTNVDHFHGSLKDLESVSEAMNPHGIPVLRKEFIFDTYQVYESRAHGADAILLIVGILSARDLEILIQAANHLWLQCLVEVHNETELNLALNTDTEIIGINSRDLHTFKTDLSVTERLSKHLPASTIIVSESGIRTRDDIDRVSRAGAQAVLVGESLITAPDPGKKLRELL